MSTDNYESRYKNRRTTAVNTSRASDDAQQVDISRNRSSKFTVAEPQSNVNTSDSPIVKWKNRDIVHDNDAAAQALDDGEPWGLYAELPVEGETLPTGTARRSLDTIHTTSKKSKAGSDSPVVGADGAYIDSNAYTPALTKASIAQESDPVKSS